MAKLNLPLMVELQQQIRFALFQLSARNAQHEFEHLCRRIARQRICSNILPATGPVGAGGDQGKDFETFRTYLRDSGFGSSAFVGSVSERALAFACTIQKDKLNQKIRGDVSSIMRGGSAVEAIHIFLAEDYPVGKRHDVQKWAREKYGVELELYDGMALAEMLSDRDLFELAVEYLHLPAEVYPQLEHQDNPAWYVTLRERWKSAVQPGLTYSNFYDFKRAVRHATYDDEARVDLSLWIRLLEYFEAGENSELQRQACYEISVARLLGQGEMNGREEKLAKYFESIPDLRLPSELEDVANLLMFCVGAVKQHAVNLEDSQVIAWQSALSDRLDALLCESPSPTERCFFLETRGSIALFLSDGKDRPMHPNLDAAFSFWCKLPQAAKRAPLYPLERLSNRFTQFIDLFGSDSRLNPLTEKIDGLLAKRSGSIVTAEKIRDRALAYHRRGDRTQAINELHRVKLSWFTEESLDGCCLALLILSDWYSELGLTFAAKYHTFAAAYIGINSPNESLRRFALRGLITASNCAYRQGCWYDFLILAERAMSLASTVPSSRAGKSFDDALNHTLFHSVLVQMFATRLSQPISDSVQAWLKQWKMDEYFEPLLKDAESVWGSMTNEDLWERFSELCGPPFSDLGIERSVTWKQLGITWTVRWKNDYATTARAEQFISVLQILLCKLGDRDLCLLETSVTIAFAIADVVKPKMLQLPSNDMRHWRVNWPIGVLVEHSESNLTDMEEALSIALQMMLDISMLSDDRFESITKELFRDGLVSTVFSARSYHSLYRQFLSETDFAQGERSGLVPPMPASTFKQTHAPESAALTSPAAGYSKESSEQAALNRYRRIPPLIAHTLAHLNASVNFRDTVKHLRKEGWLDWHILLAVFNTVMNYRGRHRGTAPLDAWARKLYEASRTPEDQSSELVPVGEFTVEKLKWALRISLPSTIIQCGMRLRNQTPLLDAALKFMGMRFGYWTDDAPHEDPFPVEPISDD